MSASLIQHELQPDGVLWVTFARPEKKNALSAAMVDTLSGLLVPALRDPSVRVVVLTGAGGAFCAGADISEFTDFGPGATAFVRRGAELVAALTRADKPVVASIDGVALGGGLELALACSLRLATDRSRFGLPEVTLGVIPAWGGVGNLVRVCGRGRALHACLTGQPVDAATARDWGLVNEVHPPERLRAATEALARRLAGWSAQAVSNILGLAREAQSTFSAEHEAALFGEVIRSEETRHTVRAFFARGAARKPEQPAPEYPPVRKTA